MREFGIQCFERELNRLRRHGSGNQNAKIAAAIPDNDDLLRRGQQPA